MGLLFLDSAPPKLWGWFSRVPSRFLYARRDSEIAARVRTLPQIRGYDSWRTGAALDDFRGKYNLQIFMLPTARCERVQLLHLCRIRKEFAGRERAEMGQSGGCNDHLPGLRVQSPYDQGVIGGGLVKGGCKVDGPVGPCRILLVPQDHNVTAVLPFLREAESAGHAGGPVVVEPDQEGR